MGTKHGMKVGSTAWLNRMARIAEREGITIREAIRIETESTQKKNEG